MLKSDEKYFWRNFLTLLILLILAMGILTFQQVLNVSQEESRNDELRLRSELEVLVAAVAPVFEQYPQLQRASAAEDISVGKQRATGTDYLRTLVTTAAQATALRITLINAEGEVLLDSSEDASKMNNHLFRPEVQMSLVESLGYVERYSNTLNKNFYYQAKAVRDLEGKILGFVRVARASEDLDMTISGLRWSVIQPALLVLGFMIGLAWWVVMKNSAVIQLLIDTTVAIAKGDYERRVPEARAQGMKRLADAINKMARQSAVRLQELTSERNRLQAIFAGMVEGVIDLDEDQRIAHINDEARRLLGLRLNPVGKHYWESIRANEIVDAVDEALTEDKVVQTEFEYKRGNENLQLKIYTVGLNDEEGGSLGSVIVLQDVTELRTLERVRTDFVANASHELKTPITAIRGLSETVLGDEQADRATLMSFMERIHAQSVRLSSLVLDLLTISRLEADSQTDSFSIMNFVELVRRAVMTARANADSKNLELVYDLPDTLSLEVFGDRQNLSQLVDNLIDNAIKYTPNGGVIKVSVCQQEQECMLKVADNGIGISPQYVDRVFERFYRVDKVRSQSLGGTGLGLSIVRNIAEKHGGTVSVVSQLGVGSTFTLRLPLAASQASRE